MKPKWAFVYLYIPILFIIGFDYSLTMDGHREFFLGKNSTITEIAPLGKPLLKVGPVTFTFFVLWYLAAIFGSLWYVSHSLKLWLFFFSLFGHGFGLQGWMYGFLSKFDIADLRWQWTANLLLIFCFAWACSTALQKYEEWRVK